MDSMKVSSMLVRVEPSFVGSWIREIIMIRRVPPVEAEPRVTTVTQLGISRPIGVPSSNIIMGGKVVGGKNWMLVGIHLPWQKDASRIFLIILFEDGVENLDQDRAAGGRFRGIQGTERNHQFVLDTSVVCP